MPEEVPRPPAVEDPIGKRKRDAMEIVERWRMVNDTCDDDVDHPTVDQLNLVAMRLGKRRVFKGSKPSSSKQSVVPTAKKPDDEVDAKTINFIKKKDFKPQPPFPLDGGTKLVFMDNLHPDIKESDVIDFFKDDGKIVKFTFFGTQISGCGDVKFETYEAAEKALKRHGEILIDRPVRLVASDDRTIFDFYVPKSEQKFLFMGNLSLCVEENDIVQFFKEDGKPVSVRVMSEDYPFEGAKSVAHVQFESSTVAYKALRRSGLMLRDRPVELVLATEKSVWYACTSSSSKPPRGPAWGPSFACKCKKDFGVCEKP